MMAKILPLDGKYYGTDIELSDGKIINIWVTDDKDWNTPSHRQLEYWDCTLEDAIGDGLMSDSHFECDRCLSIAVKLVESLKDIGE
jgi:hypothetical protein